MGTFALYPSFQTSLLGNSTWSVIAGTTFLDALSGLNGAQIEQDAPSNGQCPPGTPTYFGPFIGSNGIAVQSAINITLDGGAARPVNQLPVGFLPTAANISFGFKINTLNNCVTSFKVTANGTATDLTALIGSDHTKHIANQQLVTLTGGTDAVTLISSIWNFVAVQIGADTVVNSCGSFSFNSSRVIVDDFSVQGSYSIVNSSWVINNLTNPGSSFRPGDTAQITSSPSGSYDFSTVTQVEIGSVTISIFILQNPIQIQFVMPTVPSPTPPGSTPITIIQPTQFSGSAIVGFVNILLANASGIYTIIPGQTNDVLYLDSQHAKETVATAIPTPFGKTGFVGA